MQPISPLVELIPTIALADIPCAYERPLQKALLHAAYPAFMLSVKIFW